MATIRSMEWGLTKELFIFNLAWLSGQCSLQHRSNDFTRIKVFLCQLVSQRALVLVICLHGIEHASRFFQTVEPKQACCIRQESAGTSMLDHSGLPAGQVAQGSVADPGVLQKYAGRLHATEFTPRSLDISPVLLGRRAHIPCMLNL